MHAIGEKTYALRAFFSSWKQDYFLQISAGLTDQAKKQNHLGRNKLYASPQLNTNFDGPSVNEMLDGLDDSQVETNS